MFRPILGLRENSNIKPTEKTKHEYKTSIRIRQNRVGNVVRHVYWHGHGDLLNVPMNGSFTEAQRQRIKDHQKLLFPNDPKEWDGYWGPKSKAAFDAVLHPTGLIGDGTWPHIKMRVDGDDLILEPGKVTAFGGYADTIDGRFKGQTASKLVNTATQPDYIGCSLPMRRDSSDNLRGSPIPKLPWLTTVRFSDLVTGTEVNTKLIDEGPAKWTKHIGDLTVAAAKLFDPHATANNFSEILAIRILGGAKYL